MQDVVKRLSTLVLTTGLASAPLGTQDTTQATSKPSGLAAFFKRVKDLARTIDSPSNARADIATQSMLLSGHVPLCMNVANAKREPGTPVITFFCGGGANQQFTLS